MLVSVVHLIALSNHKAKSNPIMIGLKTVVHVIILIGM